MLWKRRLQAVVVLLGALLGLMLYTSPAQAHDVVDGDRNWGSGVVVTLTYDRAPRPGEIVTINATVESLVAAPELTVVWTLPAGAELIGGGTVDRFTDVAAKQMLLSVRQVRFPSEGLHALEVTAVAHPAAEFQLIGARTLYFTVKAEGGAVSQRDPNLVNPKGSQMPTIEVESVEATNRAANADPCFTISGKVTRLERVPALIGDPPMWGLQDAGQVPVRFARIEIREQDTFFDDSYGETKTDANGNYSFPQFCDNDGIGDGHLELYVRLYADIYSNTTSNAHNVSYVTDSSWWDDLYYFDSAFINSSAGGTFTRNFELNTVQSGIFNIADTILDGWNFWRASGGLAEEVNDFYDHTTKIHWEIDYPDRGSYYSPNTLEITIASAGAESGDPDEWDDPVILHEFSHAIEDKYACDDSLGGPHNIGDLLDDEEFAWSEGYGNYFQSAARSWLGRANANMYVDTGSAVFNLETWHTRLPDRRSVFNEGAIAAMFWDLMDGTTDDQDRVVHGHPMIQEVYTHSEFANNGWFDEDCTTAVYMTAWQALNKPANADTAAAVVQNVQDASLPFAAVSAAAEESLAAVEASLAAEGIFYGPVTSAAMSANKASPLDYQWWSHLILVTDRSKSMEGAKFNAVKTVMNETVGDMSSDAKGVEFSLYTFDNGSSLNNAVVESKFYADLITPSINGLTTNSAADPNCQVNSLRALSNAIGPKTKGNAWLFTDGDPATGIAVETLVGQLNSRHIKGSIALLGGCGSAPVTPVNTSGAAKNYLGKAANASQQGGIIPYLLTAIGSGGQFLFVDPSKIDDAAEIMRAQLSHSAGAGRWSDYVSTTPTYIYDNLTSWEYNWIDTSQAAGGNNRGVPNPQVNVPLPAPFPYYGVNQTSSNVTRYGYLTFGATPQTAQSNNTAIPNAAVPNNALYIFWEDLFWNNPPTAAAADAPDAADALRVNVFTRQVGDWYAIETNGEGTADGEPRAFQILLNSSTGEIRYQYKTLQGNSGGATVGLENANGTAAVQIGFNDTNAAKENMGYKFVPAPAQPSKTFTVPVDSLTPSVGFLLTGFSGTFAPLDVRTPNNTQISCGDTANVTCLNLGLVQYVQVKVNGRTGNWKATVTPGASNAGTFMFSAIGASTVNPTVTGQRAFPTGNAQTFRMILGRTVAGNQMDGWFTRPDGTPFGATFRFYDDGQHNDGNAGDGRFGSDAFTPPTSGVAYLWLKGTINGAQFVRSEPIPFTFQPLEVTSLGDGDNYGDVTKLVFQIKNLDTVAHCYFRNAIIPPGWTANWNNFTFDELVGGLCVNAGASVTRTLDVKMAAVSPNTLPSGASGEVTVIFYEKEAGQISDSATATVTRRRQPASIVINNRYTSSYLPPTGVATATLHAQVFDDQGVSVADGVIVNWSSTLGSMSPVVGSRTVGSVSAVTPTAKGRSDAIFTAGTTPGTALVTVMVNSLVATTTIPIHAALADSIDLASAKSTLAPNENTAALTVTVRDVWGNPVANQSVRIGVSGESDTGIINGSKVVTVTTNASGQIAATYTRGSATGQIRIIAQAMVVENGQTYPALEDQVAIQVNAVAVEETKIYLPAVTR
ncbi:MAG: hypothetical protein KF893_04620 [Caldilineaceae bacterium]|nr:hypothetical protein [Caldilineaceae bacterium]